MSKFKKLQEALQKQGYSKESAGNIAYSQGKKKYGAKRMQEASRLHKPASQVHLKKK